MKQQTARYFTVAGQVLISGVLCGQGIAATNQPQAIAGKNEWLFYSVELTDASEQGAKEASIDLISRFNKVLERNGVAMVLTMAPIKARIHSEFLPDSVTLNPYMAGNYERMAQALRAAKVNFIDLNGPFMKSPQRNGDTPLFLRLDTHWAPSGAMLAAEAVRAGLDANAPLRQVLDSIPEEKFVLTKSASKANSPMRDLVAKLPDNRSTFSPELVAPFVVSKDRKTSGSILGNATTPAISLMGSSYSAQWYRFPDALRYTLQKDLLAISVEATQGSWVGMESYLRDDAFQLNRPKLLIWEIPERDMSKPPDFKFREARYQSDNMAWLLRVAAWVQTTCLPSPVSVKVVAGSLKSADTGNITAENTSDKDFVELRFDKPLDKLDYLVARVATAGSKKMVLEASGPEAETRWFDVPVPGDGAMHALKVPLPTDGKGFATVRIFPGKNSRFGVSDLQVCRQPEDLLG